MAKFNGGYKNAYALAEMARYFGNTLKYFKGRVDDDDYFDPIVFMYGDAVVEKELIRVFGREELVKAEICRDCAEDGPRNGRAYGKGGDQTCFCQCDATDSLQAVWNTKSMQSRCRAMLVELIGQYLETQQVAARKDALRTRFEELQGFFKLNELEIEVLKYAYVRATTVFTNDPFPGRRGNANRDPRLNFYAMAMDRSVAEVREVCSEVSRLRKYDIVDNDLDLRGGVMEYLSGQHVKPLRGQFFREVKLKGVLPWGFYGKPLQRHGELIKRMISSRRGGSGVNILLYGEPGSGKTSFAKTLAKELGLKVYEVMHGDEDGRNTSLGSRLIGVQVCNEQMPVGSGIMMVDEADEILETSFGGGGFFGLFGGSHGGRRESEKGQVNSMLDNIRQPTIWISNAPASSMADSVRRRFDYSICFGKPSHEMRVSVWRNNIRKLRLGRLVADTDVDALASRYETSAGGISMVLKNLKELSPKKSEVPELIRRLMEPHCELMGGKRKDDKLLPSKDYSLEGLNIQGDMELANIVEAVKKFRVEKDTDSDPDRPRMNLLLWGPPGTGKTEFIKYLGRETGAKVVVKMGSDLLSMYVGGTEANIKQAFAQAEAEEAILFLDEIDGLVQDRSGASRSWEVTQVNELLYQMENFKGVMVGATNFMDNLDQAILRRFTFKLQFDYLDEAGKHLFFERMFKTNLTEEDVEKLKDVRNLTPGDFRTVRQSMYYLGGSVTNAQRIAALAKESEVKRDTKKAGRIGFGG